MIEVDTPLWFLALAFAIGFAGWIVYECALPSLGCVMRFIARLFWWRKG